MDRLVLASTSPRRQEIARLLGLEFTVQPGDVDESPLPAENPADTARRLAEAKAKAALRFLPADTVVIAADTLVVIDGRILGKPSSEAEARGMLRRLRNRPHEVITGIDIENAGTHNRFVSSVTTRVWMRNYSDEEIEDYVRSGEPMDKAGAYAIQSSRAKLVDRIEGCYLNVVGLPACELVKGLEAVGYAVSQSTKEKAAEMCPHSR